jgi:type III secretory pathway component EscV
MTKASRLKKGFVCVLALFTAVCFLTLSETSHARTKDKDTKKKKSSRNTSSSDDDQGTSSKSKPTSKSVKYVKSPDAIPALIELSNQRKSMIKDYADETAAYSKVKSAVDDNTLAKGIGMEEVKARFGEPVAVDNVNIEGVTKWIYKPGKSDIFSKDKIYLVFDKEGKLVETRRPQ